MISFRYGGARGVRHELQDQDDLVVVRTWRRGARHDVSPLSPRSRAARDRLTPLFGFPLAGVGVYAAPEGASQELSSTLDADPEVQFAGRGLRDAYGAPVLYTENVFVRFAAGVPPGQRERLLRDAGLAVKREVGYAENAYFVAAPGGTGRDVFGIAEELLDRDEVELCHPELLREVSRKRAFPQQWHLAEAVVDGVHIDAHAGVVAAWGVSRGEGTTICVIDDGVDIAHEEFASAGKIVAPRSLSGLRGGDPRPGDGDNHGTACAGVACADGNWGASGVAPAARLMPLRLVSGLGSQDEADAFAWAADHGADVISCSWGPPDGAWWNPEDPAHERRVPLPDSTRLAIDYAVSAGRGGRGCVVAWAAGNGAEDVDNDGYASYGNVIAVAACNDSGRQSAYSDHGAAIWCAFPSNDGAPSRTPGIWTTDRSGHDGYNPGGGGALGDSGGDYTNSFGGTSSAAPGVAGVVALMLSVAPGLTAAEVKEALRGACRRIDDGPGEYDEDGHSDRYGYGRVDAELAVAAVRGRPSLAPAPPSDG
ncbi:S8 family peptidase [Marinitenerispora sediminis]|uniref:Peptidase S8 n=1 Tax=Marinitenerispora sediminis TaxID=1931232 RepID=A0A368T2M1_9ACTN|nr:S8 family serine peptidase [Marinitenerispora sediminis]RCV49878.1 peptidase S8 [Marinitenerispora sediminis]RCV51473.1 peptidase S8 [Marinitenerispora sediminis]RCV55225.1 peptidase S8 [Marinitenerispora sediminis]